MMEVILMERIERLGQMGDVVKVKPGYARNFLLPQKKALRASKENRAYFEGRRAQLEAQNLERRKEAEQVAGRMRGVTVTMIRQAGEAGQLYGSVSARDIAGAVTEAGVTIERQQVKLDHPIKQLGLHQVRVALHPEVLEEVTVNVARSEEEAERQARGEAAVPTEEEVEREAEEAAPEATELLEEEALEGFEATQAEEGEAEAEAAAGATPEGGEEKPAE